MCFRLISLSTPSVPKVCLKDSQIGDDNLSETSDGRGGSLEQFAWVLASKDKKNSPLTINNYLLKYNSVTIIYIYIYI